MIDYCLITVSYNSARYIAYFIECIEKAADKSSFHIFISDNNSADINELTQICDKSKNTSLIKSKSNFGFCKGNNIAVTEALKREPRNIIFINPDLFLTEHWLNKATHILAKNDQLGILSGPLLHFDFEQKQPTGLIDSLGINVTSYGKWFDIAQGESCNNIRLTDVYPKAVCGALILVKTNVIKQLLANDGYIFNESYFMYKEDLELSFRIKKLGLDLLVHHDLSAYHCRGWRKKRNDMPFLPKKLSAINDVRIALNYKLTNLPFALFKLAYVYCFEYPFNQLARRTQPTKYSL